MKQENIIILAVKEELLVEEKELKELEKNIKKMQEELNRLKGIKKRGIV